MSNLPAAVAANEFTPEQVALITSTVAKGATPDELKLFLYRCQNMGLDPLKPGMVHFIKYGNNPGTMVVGIDGFRSRAAATGKHRGTKRGILRDAKGACIGAWAEVYRADWEHPAREEVSFREYSTGKSGWAKMPETMIKKVAECAALRMAFPDQLGGVYAPEEMDQAERHAPEAPPPQTPAQAFTGAKPTASATPEADAILGVVNADVMIPEEIAAIEAGFLSLQEAKDMRSYAFRSAIKNGWKEAQIKEAIAKDYGGRGFRGLSKAELLKATEMCERRPPKKQVPPKPGPEFSHQNGGVPEGA